MPHITLAEGVPGILGPMLFRRETAKPLNELAEILLRGPSSLSRADRELIATYVSSQNDCFFCQTIHGAVAAHHLRGDEALVLTTKRNPEEAPISDKLKALLAIAGKVQRGGKHVTADDVEAAKRQGASDLEIHDTVLIAAAFCMYNRYVDGLATWAPDDSELYRQQAARLATEGYTGSLERLSAAAASWVMFLRDVEQNPEPSPHTDLIRMMRASGAEYPRIWHLFAYRPAVTEHLSKFTQEIMRGDVPITPGMRELIAAFTSYHNDCPFWTKYHAAVAVELLGSEELVWSALHDLESSSLSDKDKELLRFVAKVNHESPTIKPDDIQRLHEIGWSDEALYYAVTVCALFNFYNRWIDASGVHAMSDEAHRQFGIRTATHGYIRK
jgi:uncharacterized peroxidase-related enzyme